MSLTLAPDYPNLDILSHARQQETFVGGTHAAFSDSVFDEREVLWAELQPLVSRLVRRYAVSADLREDLSSEIYLRYCTLYDAYDPSRGIPLRPYIIRMLSQATFNYMRGYWKQQSRELSLLPDGAVPGHGEPDHAEDPTSQWNEALWLEHALEALPAAIRQLPPRQQQVVVDRYYKNRSFEEIAEELEVAPATVRSLLRHGIIRLRTLLATVDGR